MAHTFRLNGLEYTIFEGAESAGAATESFMAEEAAAGLLRECMQDSQAQDVLRAMGPFVGMLDYQVAAVLGRELYQRRLYLQVTKARSKKEPGQDHNRTPSEPEKSAAV